MNINYENIKAAYYRGQNILKIYSGSTMEWEYETEPMEQTTKQIWYNSVSGDVVEPYAASAMGTVVSNTAYESKCVLEFASDVTAIGANAFSGCTDLEYVSLPVNATSIGDNAFDGCSALDGIYKPSVQRIGRESFKDCAFTAFTIPTSVTAITADAFKGVAMESFNYGGTKAQWSAITTGDFWDDDTWLTNVVHCSDGDIELYPHDYSKDYLTLVARDSGTLQFNGSTTANTISYSTDGGNTWSTPATSVTINVNSGDSVMWKGEMTTAFGATYGKFRNSTASFDVQGNIMSLAYGDNFKNQTSLTKKVGKELLQYTKVVNAENLSLPATSLTEECYYDMFSYCTSLITAPSLLATTLATSCYTNMFKGCTSLTTAPQLPATTLVSGCYKNMFNGCTSLVQAPTLPATTLASACYDTMFSGCTSLTTAPVLSATTLVVECYRQMFKGCTALTTAPQLPATTLANYCYWYMFAGCTSLTTAPELPATTSTQGCYQGMFNGCTSLTQAPQLLATTLVKSCYDRMFYGCTSLTTAPQLLATTLAQSCYNSMFYGCTNLNYIKMLATDISASDCLFDWTGRVASTGTFVKDANTTIPSGSSGIPNGWTVQNA